MSVMTSALAGVSATATAFTIPGGIIYFRGALVAPPFSVATQASGLPGGFVAQSDTQGHGALGQAATVVFVAPPYSMPSADVALNATNEKGAPAVIHVGFVDGRGQRIRPAANGAYPLGRSGGILSMQPAQPNGSAAVTVTTTYN